MSISKRRDRVIVFRVTDDEYKQLQQACEGSGNRSLSEFMRFEMLDRTRSRMAVRANIADMGKRLTDLEALYREAKELLQRPMAPERTKVDELS
jgi:uncharacterized protein (DUF1778 family)